MATLASLVAAGMLAKHEPDLESHEQPLRLVYLALEVSAWFSHTLKAAPADRDRALTPSEQVEQLLYEFVIGRPMTYGWHYHPLHPLTRLTWELRTTDVRLIGWFPNRGIFLAVCGRLKSELRSSRLYTPCLQHAVWFRNNLDLDPPKAVTGVSRHAVL